MLINENGKLLEPEFPPHASDLPPPIEADPPPPYTSSSPHNNQLQSQSTSQPRPRPTNHLSLCRTNSSIRGTYIIDPFLRLPAALLSPIRPGETEQSRKNVFLQSTNGAIDVRLEFETTRRGGDEKKISTRPIEVEMTSTNGSVKGQISDALPVPRPPLSLSLSTTNGKITLHLPRSFTGQITIKSRSSPHFSDEIQGQLTTVSESTYFLGELPSTHDSEDNDDASSSSSMVMDTATLKTTNGSVRIAYEDEFGTEEDSQSFRGKGKSGLFRFLGF
jgi:hypothetical protein